MKKHTDYSKWITIIDLTLAISVGASVAYAYDHFSTKADAAETNKRIDSVEAAIIHRLERMEDKLDKLIEAR